MSECDVCLGEYDDALPEFYAESQSKARKEYKCCECKRTIERGQHYHRVSGKWDGGIRTYRTCLLCNEIRDVFSCGGGFLFESLWEDMRGYVFEHLTTASPCFLKLSAGAKEYVLERWRTWKF